MNRLGQAARWPIWKWSALLLTSLLVAFAPLPTLASTATERLVHIESRSFQYAPPAVRVNPGDLVTLELVSSDVVHGLYLDGYGLSVTAEPGQPGRLTFVADRPGAFRFRCSVTCGPLHPFMIGQFTVGASRGWWRMVALAALMALAGARLFRK